MKDVKKILIVLFVIIVVFQSVFIYIQFQKIESYKNFVEDRNYSILRDTVDRVVSIQNELDDALYNNKIDTKSLDWMLNNYKNFERDSMIAESLYNSGKIKTTKSYRLIFPIYNQFQYLVIYSKNKLEKNIKLNNIVYFKHICKYNKVIIDSMVKRGIVAFKEDKYITTEKFVESELVKDNAYVFNLFSEIVNKLELERQKLES